jgi:hypothetical protein
VNDCEHTEAGMEHSLNDVDTFGGLYVSMRIVCELLCVHTSRGSCVSASHILAKVLACGHLTNAA